MGNGATARMHFVFWNDFAIYFLQNHTVKRLETSYSNRQGDCEQESTERMSKPIKDKFI